MAKRSYLNFDLSIERAGERYRARVLQSCAGEGNVEFELPFSEEGLEIFILKMGHAHRTTSRRIRGSDSPEMAAAKLFGEKLFGAVFQGDVYACLRASLDEAHSQGQGVRLMMRLPPELADIPWEYLYNPAWNQFFALSADTPLVRYLELTPPTRPLPVTLPLRLLAVISSPSNYPQLDVEREWCNLQEALNPLVKRGLLEVRRLESANLLTLQHRLRRGKYHILHFIGHGSFDENIQDGLLLFTDEQGLGKPLSGQYLGTLLRDHHTLRLAVLNACEGARGGREDPFAGVAHSLVQMGMPAVIAMQFEISDSAAILFAQEFYAALADGYPVDAALADARKAIFACDDREWGTPVLFTRTTDGRVFELASSPDSRTDLPHISLPAQPPSPGPPSKRSLLPDAERLYEDGLSAFYLEDWERAQESFRAALEAQPDHAAAAEKLAQVKRQVDLDRGYQQAQEQIAAQDWPAALQILEKLAVDSPKYRDVTVQLEIARAQARLAELYADARRLSQTGQWQAVVSAFEQMRQFDPTPPDPDNLLLAAQNALEEAERQRKLADLYRQALQAMEKEDLAQARNWLEQVQGIEPNYRDAKRLAEKLDQAQRYQQAQEQIAAQDWPAALQTLEKLAADSLQYRDVAVQLQTARNQARLADLYEEAKRLGRDGQWQAVVGAFDKIRQIAPSFPDLDGLLPLAKNAVAEAEHQKQLINLYDHALQALEAQNWPEAAMRFEQVQRLQPGYRDAARLLEKARAKIAHQAAARPALRPASTPQPAYKPNRWPRLAGALVGLIVLVGMIILGIVLAKETEWFDGGAAAASETRAAYETDQWAMVTQTAAALAVMMDSPSPTISPFLSLTPTPHPSATLTQRPSSTPTLRPSATLTPRPTTTPTNMVDEWGIEMVLIPAGSFRMGSSVLHTVTISHPFYMDIYEVSNAQFADFLNDQGNQSEGGVTWLNSIRRDVRIHQSGGIWSADSGYANHPVVDVTWYGAQAYCAWRGGRLPTEAEWEYAARGGLEGMAYPWGNTFDGTRANFCDANCEQDWKDSAFNDGYADTAPVGNYSPNGYGLYDMAGNVWEWVSDWYGDYTSGTVVDPVGPSSGSMRVMCGGSWFLGGISLRVTSRGAGNPVVDDIDYGFRCVVPPGK